jgi:hypothetical protein
LPGVFKKNYEQAKGLVLQFYASTLFQEFARNGIHFERAELIGSGGTRFHDESPHSGSQQSLSRASSVYSAFGVPSFQRFAR